MTIKLTALSQIALYLIDQMHDESNQPVFNGYRYSDMGIDMFGLRQMSKKIFGKKVTSTHRHILTQHGLIENNINIIKITPAGKAVIQQWETNPYADPLKKWIEEQRVILNAPQFAEGDFVLFYDHDTDREILGHIDNVDDYLTRYGYTVTEVYSGNVVNVFEADDVKRHATLDELKAAATCSIYHSLRSRIDELEGIDTAPLTRVKTFFYNNRLMLEDIANDLEWVIQQLVSRL